MENLGLKYKVIGDTAVAVRYFDVFPRDGEDEVKYVLRTDDGFIVNMIGIDEERDIKPAMAAIDARRLKELDGQMGGG